jgi:multidrug resistance protein MdtO
VSLFSAENVSELDRFWREMAPVPGRMAGSLRFALTAALATLLLLILQPPVGFIAPSLFMLFLVSHDSPYQCFRDCLTLLSGAALGTTAALLLIGATGDHPVARVVGLAVFTFVAAFFFRTSAIPAFPMAFGCLTYMVISLWEYKIRAERILHLSLWPMGTVATVALSAVVVECLFNRSDPLVRLRREIKARCAALNGLLQLFGARAEAGEIERQSAIVRRYAVTGRGQLHVLLERISKDRLCDTGELRRLRTLTLALDRLLVLGAGIAVTQDFERMDPARLERIGKAIVAAEEGRLEEVQSTLGDSPIAGYSQWDHIEQTLHNLAAPTDASAADPAAETPQAAPSGGSWRDSLKRLLLPDAFANSDYFMYALKLSLCATICYVIYNGLGWPGISTAFFTVYFTGLSTTGTSNRKLLIRIIGSTIGGMVLGIGCLVFVYPNLEGVQGFLLVIAALSFLGAWCAASPYYGYIGLQIVFSFNLLAFERLGAPNQMTPARDRLLGIALGFLVMFLIFHQVRPERTVDTMRRLLARLLGASAELIRLFGLEPNIEAGARIAEIRKQIAGMAMNLPNFAHAVKFEFPPDRAADMRLSNEILKAVTTAGDLLFCVGTWPQKAEGDQEAEQLREIRHSIENGLRGLAGNLEKGREPQEKGRRKIEAASVEQLRSEKPSAVAKAIDNFRELQMACAAIASAAE